ncbi:hypothetical protein [Crassaminicella indica]|uniref:Uncharacterized protein n=1 Tax=Crassaminicella indica TaxID=2855394 RepID=A0ABX8RB85_9CLOT|nr:hypothetical protein [Crassaminicella indica]QXM06313.1 hypothetical protein KVH43_00265 [Crassaminicella indica]
MMINKRKYFLLTMFLLLITITSFFLFINKPKTNQYKKAKLVFENLLNENSKV